MHKVGVVMKWVQSLHKPSCIAETTYTTNALFLGLDTSQGYVWTFFYCDLHVLWSLGCLSISSQYLAKKYVLTKHISYIALACFQHCNFEGSTLLRSPIFNFQRDCTNSERRRYGRSSWRLQSHFSSLTIYCACPLVHVHLHMTSISGVHVYTVYRPRLYYRILSLNCISVSCLLHFLRLPVPPPLCVRLFIFKQGSVATRLVPR